MFTQRACVRRLQLQLRMFESNVTPRIWSRTGQQLHLQRAHPISIVRQRIHAHADKQWPGVFAKVDDKDPVVSLESNFDSLLIGPDHVSRGKSDTYYVDENTVLRTHTSAHQVELLRSGTHSFLATGDCYRRDEIDRSHYPVFHQMEGVRLWKKEEFTAEQVEKDLKASLESLVDSLFGEQLEKRWVDEYFPFTEPSFELEVFFEGEWMECLGCGVVHRGVLENAGLADTHHGWAFGIGLERIAMALFGVKDIRLFWSDDERWSSQWLSLQATLDDPSLSEDAKSAAVKKFRFQEFSKYPPTNRDVAFWCPEELHENDFCEMLRDIAGDWVEAVDCVDRFTHPKTGKHSRCFRITYRAPDRTLLTEEVNEVQEKVRQAVAALPGCQLR
ncbi:MAG: hypothetical protein MHM6MM_006079 [Cercozoa sp. M6MM]